MKKLILSFMACAFLFGCVKKDKDMKPPENAADGYADTMAESFSDSGPVFSKAALSFCDSGHGATKISLADDSLDKILRAYPGHALVSDGPVEVPNNSGDNALAVYDFPTFILKVLVFETSLETERGRVADMVMSLEAKAGVAYLHGIKLGDSLASVKEKLGDLSPEKGQIDIFGNGPFASTLVFADDKLEKIIWWRMMD